MAGEIENRRVGNWSSQAIGKLNPGQGGANFVISGPVNSDLHTTGESSYSLDPDETYYVVGLGLRKDSGYVESMMTCREIRIPFYDSASQQLIMSTLKIDYRTSYPGWIYVWSETTASAAAFKGSWINPNMGSGIDIYNEYEGNYAPDLDYELGAPGPGGIIFIPYIHPNYLTTDDYNGILGNVMKTTEPEHLYTILQNDVDNLVGGPHEDANRLWKSFREKLKNLRYKNYLDDYHKIDAIGGLHAGELEVPGGNLSRCEEEGEYFNSFEKRAKELNPKSPTLQTLDFPYMSYRAISASVYVDQFTDQYLDDATPQPTSLERVWEDMQGGNVDDPETVFFIGTADRAETGSFLSPVVVLGRRTTIPVTGSILFRMDGHTAVRIVKATVYAPFLNTVFRTGEYGEIVDSFTSGSE